MANNDDKNKSPQTAKEYFERGDERYDNGDFDGAISDFNEAIRLKPDYVAALGNRGNAWGNKGEHDKAIADYSEIIRLKSDDDAAWNNRGNAWGNKGEYDKAIADYSEAIRLKPDHFSTWNNRGNAWKTKGEYDKAIADYSEAIRLKSDDAAAWNNRGNTWSDKGEYDKAIADYDEAIRLNPESAFAWNNRGNAWRAKGEYDKAIADYDEAIRLNSESAFAWNNRGSVWLRQGKWDKAIADFDEAIRLQPDLQGAISNRAAAVSLKASAEELQENIQEATARIEANTDIFQEGYDKNLKDSKKYETRANWLLLSLGVGLIGAFLLIFAFESGFIRIGSFNIGMVEIGSPEIPPPPPNEMSGATQLPAPDNCEYRADCCVQVYQNGCPTPEAAPSNGNTLSPLRLLPWLPVVTAISAPFFLWWWGLQRRRYETLTLAYGFQRKKIVEERVDIYSRKFPELHKDLLKVYVLHWMEKSPLEVMLAIGGKSKGMGGSSSAATELLREIEKTLINLKDKTGKGDT